jgi:hypothetical protein
MKKGIVALAILTMVFTVLVACGKSNNDGGTASSPAVESQSSAPASESASPAPTAASFKVGMVTDSGTISLLIKELGKAYLKQLQSSVWRTNI